MLSFGRINAKYDELIIASTCKIAVSTNKFYNMDLFLFSIQSVALQIWSLMKDGNLFRHRRYAYWYPATVISGAWICT